MSDTRSLFYDEASERAVSDATDLPTERAQNGLPTITFRGQRLHSKVDPRREAQQQVLTCEGDLKSAAARSRHESVTIVVCGAGLGYSACAVVELIELYGGNAQNLQIICAEVEPEIARKAIQLRLWESCGTNVHWLVGAEMHARLQRSSSSDTPVVLRCGASYRLNRSEYDALCPTACEWCGPERPMRILVPTPLYGGSYPIALHSAAAFRRLGHQVDELDLSPFYELFKSSERITGNTQHVKKLQSFLTSYLGELIVARALSWRADLVWAVAQTPLTPAALAELQHEGVHSALWFVEDHALFGYWRELAPRFDAVFTIQRGVFHDHLSALGVRHFSYLPCAANEEVHFPRELSSEEQARYGSRVSFVGAGYPNRRRTFERLRLPDLKIWGSDWPETGLTGASLQDDGRRVSAEETARIYTATDVNLNLHSSVHSVGVNPTGDFVNPRTFEIAACGGFQLVDHRSELGALFEPGEELVTFRQVDELPGLIKHYLENENERVTMGRNARARVLREHTYVHRMSAALTFMEQTFRRLAERRRGPNYVSRLKLAVEDDSELTEFLSQFDDDEEIDLDRIAQRIEIGTHTLSRAEGIFLLMKEFRDWGRSKGVIA